MRFLRSKFLFAIYILCFLGSLFLIYQDTFKHRTFPSVLNGSEGGVLFYDHWRSQDGYNVVNTYFEQPSCVVYSMMGDFVFRFPGGFCHFLNSGEFFTATNDLHFYNSSGRLVWKVEEEFLHHDVYFTNDEKEIFIVTGDARNEDGKKVRYDAIRGYSLKGEKIFEWKVSNYVETYKKLFALPWQSVTPTGGHPLYTQFNSVQVIPANTLEDKIPAFRQGNILVSDFRYSLIFIIDRQSKKIVWSHRLSEQEWRGAHSVRVLPNGNLFYFFNRNETADKQFYSSIVELDPVTKHVIWGYWTNPLSTMFIADHGNAAQLPNGNVLVTHHTSGGSAFEVTKNGRLVWEWAYPVKNAKGQAEPVYRVQRVSKERVDKVLRVWRKSSFGPL